MVSFVECPSRWAWAEIDLDAVAHNVGLLVERVRPAQVWAVVKADAYGHGAVPVASSAITAGAGGLCVALVSEGIALRRAGIETPILVLSEQPGDSLPALLEHRLTPTVYSPEGLDELIGTAAGPVAFHLKVDTGMQRVGIQVDRLGEFLDLVHQRRSAARLTGLSSHLATADEPDHPALARQIELFESVIDEVMSHPAVNADEVVVHLANSAAALGQPRAHRAVVRAGIALYGISPGPGVATRTADLRPVLSLRARVSMVKRVLAASSISYGHRHTFERDTSVATVPIGYADGVRRHLSESGGEVLIGGRRRRIVGVVTMDQVMVDIGDDDVRRGDEVVLIGDQGDQRITAEEWAERLDTIGYEVVCGIGPRIERVLRSSIRF
jgi:alanine racemase